VKKKIKKAEKPKDVGHFPQQHQIEINAYGFLHV